MRSTLRPKFAGRGTMGEDSKKTERHMRGRTHDGPVAVLVPPARSRFGRFMAGGLVVLALLVGAGKLGDFLPSFSNPFGSRTVDHSQPALLESLEDLSRYQAATANLQVIVDTEKDAKFLPAILRGERTVFVAAGTVDATVDFSTLDERAMQVSEDRRSVAITLPSPTLSPPRIDPERSQVVSRQRGLLDRLGSVFSDTPTSDRPLLLAAEQKMTAAASESDLRARAEENTRRMLDGMLRALGYTSVTVTFAPSPA
ncbi:MAG: DUF4230 domain-containing protein [Actinomycetota bacterium]|nr:DUF4230 domain-containing protein [Actinomycetota bacterium]